MNETEIAADYRACFGSPAGQRVLVDLMRFTRYRRPLDGENLYMAEGSRRVMLRIIDMIALTDEQLLYLHGGNRMYLGDNE